MPLALHGRTKDAVVSLPAGDPWMDGVGAFLRAVGADEQRIGRHLDLLEQRAGGRLPWHEILTDRLLPDGRPMPPGRVYAAMLVEEDRLPLYEVDGLRLSVDLHNPGNEAGVAEYDADRLEVALVLDVGQVGPSSTPGAVIPPGLSFEDAAAWRARRGATFGRLVARLAEATDAYFAYADISSTGWVVTTAPKPESVVHPAPAGIRPWDFLWSVSAWSVELLDAKPGVADRLERLELSEAILKKVDRYARPHTRIERRTLATGARFLQYRWIFGSQGRGDRSGLDTPLAKQAGLRSTNLQIRA